jgi:ADP-heptose:LPS heptosyltransferase
MHHRQGVLLVRLKSMGDVLFTLPAVHSLRDRFPDARISFLVSREYAPLLEGFRDVNRVVELDRSRFRGLHPLKIVSEALTLMRQMRRERLRLAIDLQGYGETALLTWVSGAPERWGTVYRPGRKWAYTRSMPRDATIHPAADFLALLRQSGFDEPPIRNQFVLPERIMPDGKEFFSSHGLRTDRATLFIQPFTSAAVKNWPLQRYIEVARFWRARGWQILFGGGPADRPALESARAAGYAVAAGTPLLLSAGLAHLSTLVLGGDTGLLHLAVAMGKRVVMLMRSVRPGSPHPFQHKNWAVGPQAEGLIDSIATETVIQSCSQACAELRVPL